jgi:hypothetical protein
MFNLSHFFASLFAATAQQAAEEEQREREEHVDRILEDYNSEKEEECLFFQRLDEESKQEKELASRNWYNNEREQLEWEMQNAELYGYDKEDIQSRMDSLDGQEQSESWYSNED